jgi:Family of unknown function (DUF6134)
MRTALVILGALWLASNAAFPATAETLNFVITRNGDPIGASTIEMNRTGADTTVHTTTGLAVNVLFFTAYRFQQKTSERWSNGHLVALNSTTDNNGARHKVAVRVKGDQLELYADGENSPLERDIVPSTLWNPDFLKHSTMLDVQDGQVMPVTVVDDGVDKLRVGGQVVPAHHYTINGRYSEGAWYDDQGRLVQVKIIGRDGSIILYNLMSSNEI